MTELDDSEPRIRKLDEHSIRLIAAGEVVERPASVVKELVENALDAGARSIDIRIDAGGCQSIEVKDDGCGMSPAEVELSLERHATSKIRSAEELAQVATLGFRGEALPSIAAVSRMRIDSRPAGAEFATCLRIEGGRVTDPEQIGAPQGTRIEVRDLFFNTPARRKFLKTAATEAGRVHAVVVDLALGAPRVAFRLYSSGRRMLEVPAVDGEGGALQRLAALLGKELLDHLYPFELDRGDLHVRGYLASPGHTRRDTRGYHFVLNGRVIADRQLMFAVRRGFDTLIEKGRHPIVVAEIKMPRESVDVNVHPGKHEVRFADPRAVQSALAQAIAETAAKTPWVGQGRRYTLTAQPGDELRDRDDEIQGWHRQRVRAALQRFAERPPASEYRPKSFAATGAIDASPPSAHTKPAQRDLSEGRYFSSLSLVGQLFDTYWLCQRGDVVVLVDQHAAHERLTYERLRRQHRHGQVNMQRLLVPLQIEVEPAWVALVEEHAAQLRELGFDLDSFGAQTVRLSGLPAILLGAEAEPLLRDLLADLAEQGRARAGEEALDHVYATLACHGSVRAGRAMHPREVEALFRDMDAIDYKAHCPHGRPVARELKRRAFEKLFERV